MPTLPSPRIGPPRYDTWRERLHGFSCRDPVAGARATASGVTVRVMAGGGRSGGDWVEAVRDRMLPSADAVGLDRSSLIVAVLAAVVLVGFTGSWRLLRVAVTLVHELGHALVGVLAGRRFTGFVVRGDMSGHAVTVGPARGLGRVVTTWAGYPAPGIVGALMVGCSARGWAAPLLSAVLAVLLVTATRIRSLGTAGVVAGAIAGVAGLWWWRDDGVQAMVVSAVGVVLLLGAWRHLAAIARTPRGDRVSDPAVLARLTGIPRLVWLLTFVLALAGATWLAAGLASTLFCA